MYRRFMAKKYLNDTNIFAKRDVLIDLERHLLSGKNTKNALSSLKCPKEIVVSLVRIKGQKTSNFRADI